MSTYYSSKRQFETYGAYRAKLVIDVDKSSTSVKVSWHIYAQIQYKWGVGVGIKMTGADSGSDTGYLSSSQGGSSEWKTAASKSGSVTFRRGTSSRKETFKVTAYGTSVKGHGAADSGSTSLSHTVTIPALEDYTIRYSANGGSGAPSNQTKYYGHTLTLSSKKPTRTGYDFIGWGLTSGDTKKNYDPGDKYTANRSDTLYAIWRKKTYTIKYSANGGTNYSKNSQTKTYGVTLKLFEGSYFKRSGYTLIGWGTSSSGGVKYKLGGSYTANSSNTLYAIWSGQSYTITYNVNGGQSYHSRQTKSFNKDLKLYSDTPKRQGYKFLYWKGSDGKQYKVGATYTGNKSLTLTAMWEINTNWMNVGHYDIKSGNYLVSRMNLTIGTHEELLPDIPNKYGFIGWSKTKEEIQPYDVPKNKFSKKITVPAGDVPSPQRYIYGVYRDITPSSTRITYASVIRVDPNKNFDDYIKALEDGQEFESVTTNTNTLFGYVELSDSSKNITNIDVGLEGNNSLRQPIDTYRISNRIYIKCVKSSGNFDADSVYTVIITLTDKSSKTITYTTHISKIANIFDITRNDGLTFTPTNGDEYTYTIYPLLLGPRVKLRGTTIDTTAHIQQGKTGTNPSPGGDQINLISLDEYNQTIIGGYETREDASEFARGSTLIYSPANRNIYLGSNNHQCKSIYAYGNLRVPSHDIYMKGHSTPIGWFKTGEGHPDVNIPSNTDWHSSAQGPSISNGVYVVHMSVHFPAVSGGQSSRRGVIIGYHANDGGNKWYSSQNVVHGVTTAVSRVESTCIISNTSGKTKRVRAWIYQTSGSTMNKNNITIYWRIVRII